MARSERLTFEWDRSGVHLARRTTREKPAPRGDDLDKAPRPESVWIEVRRENGDVVYRRGLRDAITQHVEVFEPDGRIRAVPRAPETGVFSVVVPLEPRAAQAVVVAGPQASLAQQGLQPGPGEAEGPRELAQVSLGRG
jgi:hypothetical protein